MDITVTLTGGGQTITKTITGGGTITVTLGAGNWTLRVRAVGDTPADYNTPIPPGDVFPPRMLRAVGETSLAVKPGVNAVTVPMHTATEVANWSQLDKALSEARNDGGFEYIFVTADISPPGTEGLTVPAGADIHLSSAPGEGTKSITRTLTSSTAFFTVTGALSLGDPARPSDELIITRGGGLSDSALINVSSGGGKLDMYTGKITGNKNSGNGGGVVVAGEFNMSGGAGSGDGGGVYVTGSGAEFNMSGGTISGNEAATTSGGGVSVGSGSFTMSGGEISGNTAYYGSGGGGGVHVGSSGSFTMEGGEISGNTAYSGGGVYVSGSNSSSFIMEGGEISGNKAYSGGGVYINNNSLEHGTFEKTGGTIYGDIDNLHTPNSTENTATGLGSTYGHAVYYAKDASNQYYRNAALDSTTSGNISTDTLPADASDTSTPWTKRP
jgi:hypothetical protein